MTTLERIDQVLNELHAGNNELIGLVQKLPAKDQPLYAEKIVDLVDDIHRTACWCANHVPQPNNINV